jgi:tRNA(adenine34) deaminase
MIGMTAAANFLGGNYLRDCSLYVSLEPCSMCAGALYWSQISKIVYGARDTKRGFSLHDKSLLHPKTEVVQGVEEEACGTLLKKFFLKLR